MENSTPPPSEPINPTESSQPNPINTPTPPPVGLDPVDLAMLNQKLSPNKSRRGLFVMLAFILVVVIGAYVVLSRHTAKPVTSGTNTACVESSFSVGSSGDCVKDLQTLVDLMETNGLNQCPFSGSQPLTVNGKYDAQTATQVKVVQTWLNCYNQQEHTSVRVAANGSTDPSTWSNLCTYGYQYPKQLGSSKSSYYQAALSAGSKAGC